MRAPADAAPTRIHLTDHRQYPLILPIHLRSKHFGGPQPSTGLAATESSFTLLKQSAISTSQLTYSISVVY